MEEDVQSEKSQKQKMEEDIQSENSSGKVVRVERSQRVVFSGKVRISPELLFSLSAKPGDLYLLFYEVKTVLSF